MIEDKKIYVISNGISVKIGVSKNPKSRLSTMSTATHESLTLEYQTDLCSNSYDIEKMCHLELCHKALNGEWFDISPLGAIKVVKSIYSTVAITVEYSDDKKASIEDFSKVVGSFIEVEDGMYKVNHMMEAINRYRKDRKMGKKQLAIFFTTNLCKEAIAHECVQLGKPISSVKVSHRGKDGGTWVSRNLLVLFFRWSSGCFTFDSDSAPLISKAIEKAIQKERLNINN